MKQTKKTEKNKKKPSRPETLRERVHRHIADINSEITDEDIRSVKTGLDIRGEKPKQKGKNNDTEETNSKNKIITPLDEGEEGYD